jgi:hypothetical protein
MNKMDWSDKEVAKDLEKILRHHAADPRMIVEALIDKVNELSNERQEETSKLLRLAGEGLVEDGNEGRLSQLAPLIHRRHCEHRRFGI